MAFVPCWECGRQISDAAEACPGCGASSQKPDAKRPVVTLTAGRRGSNSPIGTLLQILGFGWAITGAPALLMGILDEPPTASGIAIITVLAISLLPGIGLGALGTLLKRRSSGAAQGRLVPVVIVGLVAQLLLLWLGSAPHAAHLNYRDISDDLLPPRQPVGYAQAKLLALGICSEPFVRSRYDSYDECLNEVRPRVERECTIRCPAFDIDCSQRQADDCEITMKLKLADRRRPN